jgi:hypothetical protein
MEYIIKNNILQFTKLLEYEEILRHGISLKPLNIFGNDSYYENKEKVLKDYGEICEYLKIDSKNIYRPYQTHTDIIKNIVTEEPGIFTDNFINVDGLVTNQKNKILSISIADCIDLLFFDPVKKVIANTHSGWKGTYQRISVKTVNNMVDNYGCNPKDIICCIGPSIRKCHFEVDKDLGEKFYNKFKELKNINKIIENKGNGKYNIDTVLINTTLLQQKGLKTENIIDCKICTVCNNQQFHSYRAEKEKSGRNTGIIVLI